MAINPVSGESKNTIRRVSIYSLPTNPKDVGKKEADVKSAMYKPIEKVIDEVDRVVSEVNTEMATMENRVDILEGVAVVSTAMDNRIATEEITRDIADDALQANIDAEASTRASADTSLQNNIDAHIENTSNPHAVTKAQVELSNVTNDAQVKRTEMGVAEGVATLDATGHVPASQIPGAVDDILDAYIVGETPLASDWLSLTVGGTALTPLKDKIYVVQTEGDYYGKVCMWSGTTYVDLVNPDLSSYATTAYVNGELVTVNQDIRFALSKALDAQTAADDAQTAADDADLLATQAYTIANSKTAVKLNGEDRASVMLWIPESPGSIGQYLKSTGVSAPEWSYLNECMKYRGTVATYDDLPKGIVPGTYVKNLIIKAGSKDILQLYVGSSASYAFRTGTTASTTSTLTWDNIQQVFDYYPRGAMSGQRIRFYEDTIIAVNQTYKGVTSAPMSEYATFTNRTLYAGYTDSSDVEHNPAQEGDVYRVTAAWGNYPASSLFMWTGTGWISVSGVQINQTYSETSIFAQSGVAVASAISSHSTNTENPHSVTKAQVGLANVDNTSDASKPISTATQNALALKADASELANKADANHSHSQYLTTQDITGKSNVGHSHTKTDITDFAHGHDNASSTSDGFMSSEDKGHLDTLTALLEDNDADTTVDTIREVLDTFAAYPEGTTIANALAGKSNTNHTHDERYSQLGHAHDQYFTEHQDISGKADVSALTAHTGNTSNPHAVSKSQVGLGNVDNVKQYSADNPPPVQMDAHFIEGTGTTAGTWVGASNTIAEYKTGDLVLYKIPVAGASTTTLNINALGAKKCFRNNTSALTTHFGVGNVVAMVYDETLDSNAGGWRCVADYDSTDINRLRMYYARYYTGANPLYRYKLCAEDSQGRIQPFVLTDGTSTTKTVNTTPFRPEKIYYYNSTTSIGANATIGHGTLDFSSYLTNTSYTFNSTITTYKNVYLRGTYDRTTGLFSLDTSSATSWYIQVPNGTAFTASAYFDENHQYVYIGTSYSSNNYMYLFPIHTMYSFNGTSLVEYFANALEGKADASHNHSGTYSPIHEHPYAPTIHNHDERYSLVEHTHNYSPSNHDHAGVYAPISHSHSLIAHNHDTLYSPIGHRHDNATTSVDGFMSATDKSNLNTLVGLLEDNDADTTVNTIREILNAFESYPEGTSITNALAGKSDTSHTHSQYLTAHQSLANYVTLNSAQTISGAKTFTGGNVFTNETKFTNGSYCPTWADIASGIGKSSCFTRGAFMQMITGQILLANNAYADAGKGYNTEANKLKFQTMTASSGQPVVTEVASIASDGIRFGNTLVSLDGHTHPQYLTAHQNINGKLDKTTYEYNKEIAFGSSGKLCIGKFPCYDSNVCVEIKSTTATTFNGTLIIATQNINTVGGGTLTAKVYGDATNTVTSALYIEYLSGSNNVSVYFNPPSWSKNLIHIQCQALSSSPTDVSVSVDSIPSTATIRPTNALEEIFSKKTDLSTVATSGSYNDLSNKPTIPTVPTLATVATSGSYNDLSNKPTIPTTLPASDVYSWAKASSKPSYSYSELSGSPLRGSWSSGTSGTVALSSSGQYQLRYADTKTIAIIHYSIQAGCVSSLIPTYNSNVSIYIRTSTGGKMIAYSKNMSTGADTQLTGTIYYRKVGTIT